MKKPYLIFFFLILLLAGCHSFHHHNVYAADGSLKIVASTFPVYIFASNICANVDNIKLELLIPSSLGCPHDFTLRPADMRKLTQADILIINGAGLENFLTKALQTMPKAPVTIDAGVDVPKLPSDGHHNHPGHDHPEHDHMDMGGINPHIFASPSNAAIMARNIAAGLSKADPANATKYAQNGEAYSEILSKLGDQFEDVGKKAKNPNIALEHDALAYLARNARLMIVALFENSDSASTVTKLIANLKKEKPALLAGDSQYSDRLLKTLAQESGLPYASLDSCASGPEKAPLDFYQKAMEKNLKILEAHFD